MESRNKSWLCFIDKKSISEAMTSNMNYYIVSYMYHTLIIDV